MAASPDPLVSDPAIADPLALLNSLVTSLRGPLGVGYARERLEGMRRGAVEIDGLPAPLALMLAGHNGGWMDQSLLSGTGRAVNSETGVWKRGLAQRHLMLMRWAAQWPDQPRALDMLALGWLVLAERVEHPEGGSTGDTSAAARLAWAGALEKATALAAKKGLVTPRAFLDRARKQLTIHSVFSERGPREVHYWGKHTPRVALLCAHAFPPGMGEAGEDFWLAALDVLHRTGTGWNPVREPGARRHLAGPTISAVAGRLAHPQLCRPPSTTRPWVDALGLSAATEALMQCWVVSAQPTNPAVPLDPESCVGLAQQWTQAVQRHIQDYPAQALRLDGLARDLCWQDRPMWEGLPSALESIKLEQALPGPSAERAPLLRL